MFKKLMPYMRSYKKEAILSPLFMTLEVIADVLIPFLMADIVDVGIRQGRTDIVLRNGIWMIVVAFLGMFFGATSAFIGTKAGRGFAANLRLAQYKNIQTYSFRYLDVFGVPSLITRLTNDTNMLGMVATMTLRMAVRSPMMLILAFFMSIRINAELALVFAVAMPLIVIIFVAVLRKARPLFRQMQERIDDVNLVNQENLTAIRVVKAFNRHEYETDRFGDRNDALKDTALKAISIVVALFPLMSLIIYGTIIAALWLGGQRVVAGGMEAGELVSFITYITQVLMSLTMLSMYFMQLTRASAAASRVLEVLETSTDIKSPEGALTEVPDGSVAFEDVCFVYPGAEAESLRDINFSLASGEILGIIGSTGSSKSTLVQLLPRLYDATEGVVKVGGHDVRDYDLEVLRDRVAFVLQQNTLFSGTIRSNMQWGNPDATDEEIIDALKDAAAWEFVSKYKDGLDHKVEQDGSNFSGGQKQRLSIARSLLKDPKVIILDDSTSAVDMTTDAKIRHTFKERLPDVTTIVIAQRVASIEHADHIMVMHDGAIESYGQHEELLETSPIYKEIYESQQKGVVQG